MREQGDSCQEVCLRITHNRRHSLEVIIGWIKWSISPRTSVSSLYQGTNKSLLRVDSSFSFMPYYPSDLQSLSPTNAVKTCTMNVQETTCAMRPLPHLPPPPPPFLSGPTLNVTLLSRAALLSVFALCFANTAEVSRRKNSLR